MSPLGQYSYFYKLKEFNFSTFADIVDMMRYVIAIARMTEAYAEIMNQTLLNHVFSSQIHELRPRDIASKSVTNKRTSSTPENTCTVSSLFRNTLSGATGQKYAYLSTLSVSIS